MSSYQAEAQITSSSSVEGDDVFVDDQRGDGKKKKFKPFQKVRNFFRGGSSKKRKPDEGDGLGYSRSTGALHHKVTGADDDDDGGFRRKGLAGSRSISEDSVFQPEPKEPGIAGVLKGQTVSMEAINTGFQAELFSKLKARQSDSDLDEGLPYSPAPISPTSHMFQSRARAQSEPGPEKPAEDSQLSLYSMDGSEEDLFSSNWKSGVASMKTRSSSGSELDREMDVADFEEVSLRSTHLSNEAAKHRISVKPKSRRLSAKMSMKKKEKPTTPVLSGVKEEEPSSPVRLSESKLARPSSDEQPGVSRPIPVAAPQKTVRSTTIAVGSPPQGGSSVIPPRSEPREIPGAPRRHMDESELNKARSLSPISTSPVSKAALDEVKLKSRPLSGKFEGVELKREPLQSDNELSKAFNRAKRISRKYGDDGNIVDNNSGVATKPVEVKKTVDTTVNKPSSVAKDDVKVATSNKDSTALPQQQTSSQMSQSLTSSKTQSSTTSPTSTPISPGVSGVSFVLKKEPLRPGNKTPEKPTTSAPESHPLSSAEILAKETKDAAETGKKDNTGAPAKGAHFGGSTGVVTRAPIGASVGASGAPTGTPSGALMSGLTSTEVNPDISTPAGKIGSEEKLASPREEYRLKRQNRSKTLPVSKEMIDKAEELDKPGSRTGSPPLNSLTRSEYDNVNLTPKPIQSKRSSWAPAGAAGSSSTTTPIEPSWMVRAKLKNMEQDNQNKEVKVDIKKDVKTELKSNSVASSEKASDKPEKGSKVTEKPPVTSNIKSIIEKSSNASPSMMSRSWAPSYSAKSFDKPNVQASAKPMDRQVSTDKSEPAKVIVASATKPTVTSQNVSIKPSVTGSSKPAVSISSAKPSVANTKTVSSVNTDNNKPSSQGIRPTISSVNKSAADNKPLSQSMKTNTFDNKFSQFGGKVGPQKPIGGTVQPLSQSVKVTTQSASRPTVGTSASIAKTSEPVKPSVSSADTKKNVGQENKKQEADTKRDAVSKSPSKSARSAGNVPPWKQALNQRKDNNPLTQQVKIEIIDKEPEKTPEKKAEQKPPVEMRDKGKTAPDKCSDANRSSKVLDMVRSFQNLQVT